MLSLREYREPTDRLPDYLVWAGLVGRGVIIQKDAIFQKTIAFRGPDLASSSDAVIVSAVARINNGLRRLGSGWTLFIEAQRFRTNHYPTSNFKSPAAWIIDEERRAKFEQSGAHFESSYYVTFAWKVPPDAHNRAAAFFYDDPASGSKGTLLRDLAHFEKTVGEITDILRAVFPEVGELDDEQTLSYLHSTISTNRHPVRVPEVPMYLEALLPDMAFTPGDIPMLGDHFMPTCTINGFPGSTTPGILDALNHLRCEYRWVTRFICMDKDEAERVIEKYQKGWLSKRKGLLTLLKEEACKQESALVNNSAANKAADADAARQELGDDLVGYGYLTTTVSVWDEDFAAARAKMQAVKKVIQGRGFVVKDETLNSAHAWLGSSPGHVYANVRQPIVSTLNLAHLMPVSSIWAGNASNAHLEKITGVGTPHVYCSTTGDTPFRLNLNVGDVGHTLIIGPTGAGKSTLLGLLALQWLKYPDAQVIVFDKDRSARAATLAVGGTVYEPGNEDANVAFQPLAHIHEPAERIWVAQFIQTLLTAQGIDTKHDVQSAVDETLANLAAIEDPRERTLTHFVMQLRSYNRLLGEALRPYTLDGNYGQIFDADHDDVTRSAWTMIEMGHLMGMGQAALIPALEYLFHRVEAQFDGRPTLMIVDEAWLFLSHPVFAGRLQSWLKTLRKKNVYVVFATQEVADATSKPELMSTILSACHTKIFLPDEEALTPAMTEAYEKIGLSLAEIQILAKLQKKRDYYLRNSEGQRQFRLDLGPAQLALVGMSNESDQRFLDGMIRTVPREQYARSIFARRNVSWPADSFPNQPIALEGD